MVLASLQAIRRALVVGLASVHKGEDTVVLVVMVVFVVTVAVFCSFTFCNNIIHSMSTWLEVSIALHPPHSRRQRVPSLQVPSTPQGPPHTSPSSLAHTKQHPQTSSTKIITQIKDRPKHTQTMKIL